MHRVADAHGQGTIEGLAVEHFEASAELQVALVEIPQHRRLGVRYPDEPPSVADGKIRHPGRLAFVDLKLRGGNGGAVRVMGGVAKLGGNARFEILGENVLERLGLLVYAVPRYLQMLGEIE